MALTFANLRTLVYRYGFDTTDPVDMAINAAMFEVINYADWDWRFNRVQSVTMGPSDSVAQNLPSDLFKISSLKDITHDAKLSEISPQSWDEDVILTQGRGIPSWYSVIASQLYLWPLAREATTYAMTYERGFDPMVNPSDEPAAGFMPEHLRYAIMYGAAATLLQMENEEDRSTVAQAKFDTQLAAAIHSDMSDLDSFSQVRDTQGYGSY
jgi:hypothetical protein